MHLLIVFSLISFAFADLPGYSLPTPSIPLQHGGGSSSGYSHSGGGGFGGSAGGVFGGSKGFGGSGGCSGGHVRHFDGSCVQPIINRNFFHYTAPQRQFHQGPQPTIPTPKVDYNIVFVRTPETPEGQGPIVVPPPQQKTLVYVLSENDQIPGQQVIEVPSVPQTPEVYYINYDDGDNPTLPGGFDLQSALASAAKQQGQVIEGGGTGFRGASGFGGSFGDGSHGSASFGGGSHGSTSYGGGSHGSASFGGGSHGGGQLSQTYGTP